MERQPADIIQDYHDYLFTLDSTSIFKLSCPRSTEEPPAALCSRVVGGAVAATARAALLERLI